MADFENEFEELENALIRAGRSITFPAPPPLAARVRALSAPPRRAGQLPRPAAVALAALVVAIALLVAFPGARDAIARILGLRTIHIIPVTPTSPLTPQPPLPSPTSERGEGAQGARVEVRSQCCETTLENAQARAQFKILLPPAERPARVYLQEPRNFGGAQQVILVFGDPNAPRFVLYEATNFLYGKMVNGGTVIEETQMKAQRALWLTGAPHLLAYLDANGQPQMESERSVSANTLAWEIGSVTYRLETNASKEEAIRFAKSLQ